MRTGSAPPAFVGRQAELARLEALANQLIEGRGSIVVVEGEAGIGKTRLVGELVEPIAAGSLATVLAARARELERSRPFAAIAAAVGLSQLSDDQRRSRLAALVAPGLDDPPLSIIDDAGLQYRIVDELVALLEDETMAAPVVVVVDDLQWADPATVAALDAAARRLQQLPIMFVVSLRPLPRSADLVALLSAFDHLGAHRVAVAPLDAGATADLAADLIGSDIGPSLGERVEAAAGNPFFVIELVTALMDAGAIDSTTGRAEVRGTALPVVLRDTVVRRVGFLPDRTLQVLRIAATLGTSFPVELLATTAGVAPGELVAILAPALQAGIVEDGPSSLGFRHDLVREAVYDALPASLRAALHLDIARRLVARGAAPLAVADHLCRGAEPGDVEAVAWLERAASEAAPRSPAVAVDLLGRALELVGDGFERRDELTVHRAAALLWAGRTAEAAASCRALLATDPEPDLAVEAACWLGLSLFAIGDVVEAAAVFERAAATAQAGDARAALLLAYTAHARMLLGDLVGAGDAARRALATTETTGDTVAACLASAALTFSTFQSGDFRAALDLAEHGVELADRSHGRVGHRFQMEMFRASCLVDLDRIDDGIAALQRGLGLCAEHGTRWNLPVHHVALAVARFLAGDWDDALAECATATALAQETDTRFGRAYGLTVEALIAFHRDELADARGLLSAAGRELRRTGPHYRADWTVWAKALLLEADGRVDDACSRLERAFDACLAGGFLAELPTLGPDLVRFALAAGDRARAEKVCLEVQEVADHSGAPWVLAAAMRCRGLVADDADVLLSAVDQYRSTARVLDAGLAREAAASALRRHGQTDQARSLLIESLETYTHLGARRCVARVAASLRRLGVRVGVRGSRRRPSTGWDSLTATERRVVALVSEGLSNPQIAARLFVSPRTVQTHLAHVFPKLGVSTRRELAAVAQRASG